jgi:hypothetical protein
MNASGPTATMLPSGGVGGSNDDVPIGDISALALVSLVLGMASPLSLVAPLLWAIPLVGAALAIMTIRRIASSDGALVGRLAAVIGLALCVGSLAAAASRSIVTEQVLSRQAREFATEWLGVLQSGDTQTAFGYTAASMRGPAPPPPPGAPAEPEPKRDPLADFRDHPLVRYMTSVGKDAEVKFDRQVGNGPETAGDARLTEDFSVTPVKGSSAPAVTVHVALQRSQPTSLSPGKWLISDYSGDNLPGASTNAE